MDVEEKKKKKKKEKTLGSIKNRAERWCRIDDGGFAPDEARRWEKKEII